MSAIRMSDELFRKRAAEENGCMISAIGLKQLFGKQGESSQHRSKPAREPVRFAFGTVSYLMVGLGIGALVGILLAPKSGEETRQYLEDAAEEGRDYARRKARELRERADDLIERSKDVASRQRESISAAVEAGRETYQRGKVKAP